MLKVEPTGQLSRATIESGGYYRGDTLYYAGINVKL